MSAAYRYNGLKNAVIAASVCADVVGYCSLLVSNAEYFCVWRNQERVQHTWCTLVRGWFIYSEGHVIFAGTFGDGIELRSIKQSFRKLVSCVKALRQLIRYLKEIINGVMKPQRTGRHKLTLACSVFNQCQHKRRKKPRWTFLVIFQLHAYKMLLHGNLFLVGCLYFSQYSFKILNKSLFQYEIFFSKLCFYT